MDALERPIPYEELERRAEAMLFEDLAGTGLARLIHWEELCGDPLGEEIRRAYLTAAKREAGLVTIRG